MNISAVTIVKNEAKNIGRWLHSVNQYADEIIVVDTGSTDNTVEIVTSAGVRVEYFPWIDDFAAAKNYALDLCHGQWIAFLDADEYFEDDTAKKIRPLLTSYSGDTHVAAIMTRLANIDQDQHNRLLSYTYQVRLFRNLRDIRYEGKIHETLTGLNIKNRTIKLAENMDIIHTGYSSRINRQKVKRNLTPLLNREENGTCTPADYSYLADCYYGLQDYENALKYIYKYIATGNHMAADETLTYALACYSRYMLDQPTKQLLPDAMRGISAFPDSAIFFFITAMSYFREKEYICAAKWYDDGFAVFSRAQQPSAKSPYAMINGANFGDNLLHIAHHQRGQIYDLAGDTDLALDHYLAGLKAYRYSEDYIPSVLRLLAEHYWTAVDVIRLLGTIYTERDAAFLCSAIYPIINQYPELAKVYAYYAKKGNVSTDNPLLMLALGNYSAIIDGASRTVK